MRERGRERERDTHTHSNKGLARSFYSGVLFFNITKNIQYNFNHRPISKIWPIITYMTFRCIISYGII